MRLVTTLLLLAMAWTIPAEGQWVRKWINYDVINPGNDQTRSIAYNPVTDHLLVATRKFGNAVLILDPATGDSLGQMNTAGISGGTLPINMVAVAEDGTIYVSNLIDQQFTPGGPFKVYRYADESAAPVLVLESVLDLGRYGDALAATTDGVDTYVYASGKGNPNMAVFSDDGGATLTVETPVPLPQPGNARHGISPLAPGGNVWVNGADDGAPAPRLVTPAGTFVTVPDSFASAGGTSTILATDLNRFNIVTVANSNVNSATIRSIKYDIDQVGNVVFDYFGMDSDSAALFYQGNLVPNINATAMVQYDPIRHTMFALMGVNGLGAFSMDSLIKASTPREGDLEVSMDGLNDFFPSDRVGVQGEREGYLTWAPGKVFVGMTGETLIDPTFANYMFVAFDLDPSGTDGSATPPVDAGGVAQLPFRADVFYLIEPFDQADYMIGEIYKWNGSAWIGPEFFDGNLASQGALAFADEGEGKIAEFAAIKNAAGIGENFADVGVMFYLAEEGAAGNVLAAYPDVNPTGNGATFTHYFYTDSLGRGVYPRDTTRVPVRRSSLTAIDDRGVAVTPADFELAQNYPNPFNPETTIEFGIRTAGRVDITVFDITGRQVAVLAEAQRSAGRHAIRWDGRDDAGNPVATGVYFYRLAVDGEAKLTRKMLLLK